MSSVKDDPERKLGGDTELLAGGEDHRLPQSAGSDPKQLARLAQKASVKLQRAANRMAQRITHIKLWGENADKMPERHDQAGVQILLQMRDTIKLLEEIEDLEPYQRVVAIKTRLTGLQAMAQCQQAILAEISRVTASNSKTLVDLAKLAIARESSGMDDIPDAELA